MTCRVKRCGFEGLLALVYCGVGVSVGVGGGGGHAGLGGVRRGAALRVTRHSSIDCHPGHHGGRPPAHRLPL